MPKRNKTSSLMVNASSPFHVYYTGEAVMVSALNSVGPFDVLPGHIGFFAILSSGEVVIDPGDSKELISFTISNGIMSVRNDNVEIFTDI